MKSKAELAKGRDWTREPNITTTRRRTFPQRHSARGRFLKRCSEAAEPGGLVIPPTLSSRPRTPRAPRLQDAWSPREN